MLLPTKKAKATTKQRKRKKGLRRQASDEENEWDDQDNHSEGGI